MKKGGLKKKQGGDGVPERPSINNDEAAPLITSNLDECDCRCDTCRCDVVGHLLDGITLDLGMIQENGEPFIAAPCPSAATALSGKPCQTCSTGRCIMYHMLSIVKAFEIQTRTPSDHDVIKHALSPHHNVEGTKALAMVSNGLRLHVLCAESAEETLLDLTRHTKVRQLNFTVRVKRAIVVDIYGLDIEPLQSKLLSNMPEQGAAAVVVEAVVPMTQVPSGVSYRRLVVFGSATAKEGTLLSFVSHIAKGLGGVAYERKEDGKLFGRFTLSSAQSNVIESAVNAIRMGVEGVLEVSRVGDSDVSLILEEQHTMKDITTEIVKAVTPSCGVAVVPYGCRYAEFEFDEIDSDVVLRSVMADPLLEKLYRDMAVTNTTLRFVYAEHKAPPLLRFHISGMLTQALQRRVTDKGPFIYVVRVSASFTSSTPFLPLVSRVEGEGPVLQTYLANTGLLRIKSTIPPHQHGTLKDYVSTAIPSIVVKWVYTYVATTPLRSTATPRIERLRQDRVLAQLLMISHDSVLSFLISTASHTEAVDACNDIRNALGIQHETETQFALVSAVPGDGDAVSYTASQLMAAIKQSNFSVGVSAALFYPEIVMSIRSSGDNTGVSIMLEQTLQNTVGVISANCDPVANTVRIKFDYARISLKDVVKIVNDMGFNALPLLAKTQMLVHGMSCGSCAARIESKLSADPRVYTANVNFATNSACVVHDAQTWPAEEIEALIQSLGYRCTRTDRESSKVTNEDKRNALTREDEIEHLKFNFLVALLMCIPLWVAMALMDLGAMPWWLDTTVVADVTVDAIVEAILSSVIVCVFGRQFFINAYHAALTKLCTMDTLIALGVGVAQLSSITALGFSFAGRRHYFVETYFFDTSASLVVFILFGRYLEAHAKKRTTNALVKLMDMQPQKAILVRDFHEVSVDAATIARNDIVKVKAGDRVPVDGVVVHGESLVDESLLSGESVPVNKAVGDHVTGGTINHSSTILVRAEKVGDESTLAQIMRLVHEAQNTKPEIQRMADRVSNVFVPAVLGYALIALLVWCLLGYFDAYPKSWRNDDSTGLFAMRFFITTLVIACPCAMGLATPTAVMVTTGVGARLGILIKGGHCIEIASKTNAIIFDKTGTLTLGKLTVCDMVVFDNSYSTHANGICSAVTHHSTHPVSKAIHTYLGTRGASTQYEADKVETVGGKGVVADIVIEGTVRKIALGSLTMIEERLQASNVPDEVKVQVQTWQTEAKTVVVASVDSTVITCFALRDDVKPESHNVVMRLQQMGVKTYMVTGDNRQTALSIASKVGIPTTNVAAEVLPQDKARFVQALQGSGNIVAFVGDGINDSPALASADVGIALGAGTDVAMEAADAVLVRSHLGDVFTLLDLSRVALQRIRWNLMWAFGYNVLALPFASGIFFPLILTQMPPMYAGLAMIFSSLSVLTSSLALKCYRSSYST